MSTEKINIAVGKKNVVRVELINKKITKEDIKDLENAIDLVHKNYSHVNIIILLKNLQGSTCGANLEAIKMVGKEKGIIKKIAVVSDSALVNLGIIIENWVTPWKEKYFQSKNLSEAWEWLQAE